MLRREIKRLLLPLLAAVALPTAVNAAEVYLLVNIAETPMPTDSASSFVIPMKTLTGYEDAGLKLISSDRFKLKNQEVRFECVESK